MIGDFGARYRPEWRIKIFKIALVLSLFPVLVVQAVRYPFCLRWKYSSWKLSIDAG
jgi:hypothetical protein